MRKLNKIRMWAVRIITALVILMELFLAAAFDGLNNKGIAIMVLGLVWLVLILWANPFLRKIGEIDE